MKWRIAPSSWVILSCGDAYVEGAFIYDDPNKQFITWEAISM